MHYLKRGKGPSINDIRNFSFMSNAAPLKKVSHIPQPAPPPYPMSRLWTAPEKRERKNGSFTFFQMKWSVENIVESDIRPKMVKKNHNKKESSKKKEF